MALERLPAPDHWSTLLQRRPLILSLAVALTVSAALAILVLGPLISSPDEGPPPPIAGAVVNITGPDPATATAPPTVPPTPWPRRPRDDAAPAAPPTDEPVPPTATTEPETRPTARPLQTVAPTATAASPSPTPAGPAPLYLADFGDGSAGWSGPNWSLVDGELVNDGRGVDTSPWIVAPDSPSVDGGYAVEAEIRVVGTASGYCEQNFGLVAIAPNGRVYLGGGLLFTCDGEPPVVRITDVTNWGDGYNRDQALASDRLDLASGWHTFRLEISEERVRLLIDGELVVDTAAPSGTGDRTSDARVGLWSQGVQVAVRRVAIVSLARG